MNICVTVNSAYVRYLYIMLKSLYIHNKGNIELYVINRDFTQYDKNLIEKLSHEYDNGVHFVSVSSDMVRDLPTYLLQREGVVVSIEVFFRILIPDLLPNLDKVLMLDVDLVINKNISPLYNMDLSGYALAASPNMSLQGRVPIQFRDWYSVDRVNWTHYNSGVLLWNLEYIREKYGSRYLYEQARKSTIKASSFEEEVVNTLFGEKEILRVDEGEWNYIVTYVDILNGVFKDELDESVEELETNHAIIHYQGRNPWSGQYMNNGAELWWKYTNLTPFAEQIRSETIKKKKNVLREMTKINNELKFETYAFFGIRQLDECLSNGGGLVDRIKRNIYLYGAGMIAEEFYHVLNKHDMVSVIKGVFDKHKVGLDFHGIPIRDIKIIRELGSSDTLVITPVKHLDEIFNDIDDVGASKHNVCTLVELLTVLK